MKGDCNDFNEAYPSCEADPVKVLDPTECNEKLPEFNEIYLTAECGYDNGACCESKFDSNDNFNRSKLGDGKCDEHPYNSAFCQVRHGSQNVHFHF